jgi:hypothetical protein
LDLNTPTGTHLPLSKEMISYCASGASLPAVEFAENNILISKGFHIDFVDGLTLTLWDEEPDYVQIAHQSSSYGCDDMNVREALWRTFSCGKR